MENWFGLIIFIMHTIVCINHTHVNPFLIPQDKTESPALYSHPRGQGEGRTLGRLTRQELQNRQIFISSLTKTLQQAR